MKDYYENKIAHLKEQIEDLELKVDGIKYRIEFYQRKLPKKCDMHWKWWYRKEEERTVR